jgi:multiple sugar transport system permease protein
VAVSAPPAAPGDTTEARAPSQVLGVKAAVAFVTPALVIIGTFLMFPALWTLYIGITNLRLTGAAARNPQVVGLDNFTQAFSDPRFLDSLVITAIFVALSAVVGQTVVGLSLAWMFRNWRGPGRQVLEVLVIFAWIIPGSVVAFLWIALLDGRSGTLNAVLPGGQVEWLLEHPLASIIVFNVWRGSAFAMLLFGAALNTVPPSHLETARLAGARSWRQFVDIVLPAIRGHVLTGLLLISLWTFNLFTPYLLTRGGPNFRTEVVPIYIFRVAINQGELGLGAAISAVVLVINLVIALVYLRAGRNRTA